MGYQKREIVDVTAVIPTRDRYFSTLPLTILSVIQQTVLPKKLIIYDDGEKFDLRNNTAYSYMFKTLERLGVAWEVKFGDGTGQAKLHNASIGDSSTEYIWRIDDDCVAEPNVLSVLYNTISADIKIGAVGGTVADPAIDIKHYPKTLDGSMSDVVIGMNVQWFTCFKKMNVQHLYSSFIYRKAAASHGYRLDLSRAGHREETIFTYEMWRNAWDIVFQPDAVTWHYRNKDGGIRSVNREGFDHDEELFQYLMQYTWKINPQPPFMVVLDNGIGDHYAFKQILPEIISMNKGRRIIIACCYDIFEDSGVETISIGEAFTLTDITKFNIYKFMADNNWQNTGYNIVDAFKKMYNV